VSEPKLIPADMLKTLLDDLMVEESITRVELIRGHISALTDRLRTASHLLRRIEEADSLYGTYFLDTDYSVHDWLNRRDQFIKDAP
jgi:hypothetical protein